MTTRQLQLTNRPRAMRPQMILSCVLSCSSHYNDVIMNEIASQFTSLTIVYSTVYSGADQRKYQSSASPAFVRGIHRWPVSSPHKRPVTRKCLQLMTPSLLAHFTHVVTHNRTTRDATVCICYRINGLSTKTEWKFEKNNVYYIPGFVNEKLIGYRFTSDYMLNN